MPELRGEKVVLRDVRPEDGPALRAMHAAPEVAAWWGLPKDDFLETDDDADTLLAMEADGQLVGYLQFYEERDADCKHATIDLFLDPGHHRRGLGSDALRTVIGHLVDDRGHHRITIDPAVDNAPAIACYRGVGFRDVGVMRAYWRDLDGRWRDTLFMELVVLEDG
ncbi:GNAT family N-acetyltransferase [Conexibacter sp. SYSU D00693]|uniref:GNAT family N-acetyltransferase n=1 Tax=Conexibacter sp. SYSU D00693 TaxID=2812560 RepID=UPI00196A64C0|nr:GNAT family protein [Conexibacter sp. SYSU D00693]